MLKLIVAAQNAKFFAIKSVKDFHNNQSGATAIEYGLIAALISVVIITGVTTVGTQLGDTFSTVTTKLTNANAAH